MKYCSRCVLPETAFKNPYFTEKGLCAGCVAAEEKETIDWDRRRKNLGELFEQFRNNKDGSNYDCIIPVSGGKDSHYQTHLVKKVFGLKPLLVTHNHEFNTKAGMRNLTNLVTKFGCDHLRFSPNPTLVKNLSRASLTKMGDICWHCHAGVMTYPFQIAVKFNIPLIVWGEPGMVDIFGEHSYNDFIELTARLRNIGLRKYHAYDMVSKEAGISRRDMMPYVYPDEDEIRRVGIKSIYLANYIKWNAKDQTDFIIKEYGFETAKEMRSFNPYSNVECHHCGGAHDWLGYLKFGYGRASTHASVCIRDGIMSREEAIALVEKYDYRRPANLQTYLDWADITEKEFEAAVDDMRDRRAWEYKGKWQRTDTIADHINDPHVEEVRLPRKGEAKFICTSDEIKWEGKPDVL